MKNAQVTSVQAFGKRLAQLRREKACREERDIWPIDVAKAVNAGQSSVARWEGGEVFPLEDAMERLAAFYGVTRSWLRYGEGEKPAEQAPTIGEEPDVEPGPRRRADAKATKRRKAAP